MDNNNLSSEIPVKKKPSEFFGVGIFLGSTMFFSFFAIQEWSRPILSFFQSEKEKNLAVVAQEYDPQTSQEEAVIRAVDAVSPAVVSIVVTKDVPVFREYYFNPFQELENFFGAPFGFNIQGYQEVETQREEVGGGSGFIVSSDGTILTNKHVVIDEAADYSVLTNEGQIFDVRIVFRDPGEDLAILKIEQEGNVVQAFPVASLGDSDRTKLGQTVIAIGNALGEFTNTISVGVVSGLGRTITAQGGGFAQTIEDVIQTDAAINRGNSGGPLVNLKGEVIGINTAMVQGAQSIGFAIPINKARNNIGALPISEISVLPGIPEITLE